MFEISKNDYKNLILGASIYSTGGGIPFKVQINKGENIFKLVDSLKIFEMSDFKENDFICNIYGVGSAGDNSFDVKAQFEKGFKFLREKFGYNISSIFEAETNIESILFEMSLSLNLPIFDADCTGGRAVPELIYDNFVVEKKSFLPVIVIDKDLNIYTITKEKPVKEIEEFLRNLYVKTGSSVAVIDHIVSIKEARDLLTLGVLKRDLELGKALEITNNLEKILPIMGGELIGKGIITEINLENTGGFLQGNYIMKLDFGDLLKIEVKNENMFIEDKNGEKIVDFPDFIISVYKDNFIGIHNSSIKVGDEILLIKKSAEKRWKEKYKKNGN